ncbi:centrosomal protein of 85 kDa-like isoform X2 [Cynoglossus semilaevis]|uniref:centrosomal protein of 85 kDa-like isoform X2 n=1 Tax=Cynoglossus semilaevis TaxID=244447 RepID=UPI0007DCA0CE|nr:centrosomal protein of 85 kDa-like isoform X2 [Cynoglossus semilaevis]
MWPRGNYDDGHDSDHKTSSGSSGSAEWLPGQDLLWSTNPLSSGSSLYMGLRHRTVSGSGDSGIGTYYSDSLEDSTQKNPPSPLNMKKYPPMRRCSSLTKLSSVADKSTAKTLGHLYNPGFQGSLDRGLFNHHKKVCGSKVDLHLPLTSSSSSHNLLQYSVGSLPCNHYTRSPGSRALSLSPSSLTSPVKHPSLDNSLSALTAAEVGYSGRQLYGLSSCVGPYVGESSLTSPSLSKTMFLTDQYKPTAECQKSAGARKTSPGKQRHQQEPGLHQLFKVSGHVENPLKVKEGLLRDRELEINWQRQEILLLQAQISENVHRAQQLLQSQRGWLHDANDRNKEESDVRIAPEMPCGDEDLNQKLAVAEIKVLHLKNVYQQVIEKYAEDMRKLQKKIKTRDRYISCLNKKFQRECDQSREKQQQIETLEKYLCDLPSPEVVHVQAQQEQVQQKTKELGQKVSDIQKSLEEECALIKDKMLRIELQAKREKELISSVHSLQQKVQECLDDGVRLSMQDLKQLEVENIQLVEQDVRSSQLVQRQKEQIERLTWQLMAVSVRLQKKRGLCHNQNETLLNTFRAVTQVCVLSCC